MFDVHIFAGRLPNTQFSHGSHATIYDSTFSSVNIDGLKLSPQNIREVDNPIGSIEYQSTNIANTCR